MFKKVVYILVLLIGFTVFGQNYTKHTVVKGETIASIAQKYNVTPFDIYKLNPDSQNGIQLNSVILIPKSVTKTKETTRGESESSVAKPTSKSLSQATQIHIVKPKETLYSLTKLYTITVEELEKNNPFLKTDGLQPGQELVINKNANSPKMDTNSKMFTQHEVQPKETKYGIANTYGISVEELEKQNPEIVASLPVGYKLKIHGSGTKTATPKEIISEEKAVVKTDNVFEYIVKAGETLYSLTKQFNITTEKLTSLNPQLTDGVKEGMLLKLPASISYTKTKKNQLADLTQTISKKDRIELVLLLPFNISKIESDTLVSTASRLKKDKFLNMTLDFYSGALMAIDSAKVLGMNINVKIYDSQETKFSSNAVSIVRESAQNADAVIGPFYQNHVEKVAEILESKNIPVISPLSKDYEKSYKNLYQATPNNDLLKQAMFDYMKSKNGNIIAVVDLKKPEIKQYLIENQKDTKLVGPTEKGSFVSDSIRKYFVKDRLNFVVMESESYYTITSTLTAMTNAMKDYQLQLVILEPNEMLDNEEIALSRLTKLKMTYPSLTRENESPEAARFEKTFKKKNRVLPNQYAVRGFDITFDTMLRLSQEKQFKESVQSTVTEQIENKFDYDQKVAGGYINNGIYILYYNTDLTIKQAE